MTRYEELCEAYYAREPHELAIDALFREIPEKMKQAISDLLQVPAAHMPIPSLTSPQRPTEYVELCRYRWDKNGQKDWEICPADEYLWVDQEGICHFVIGISLVRNAVAIAAPSMVFFEFTIESVDEDSAELQLAKTGDQFRIDFRNPDGYAYAAERVTTHLVEFLRSPVGRTQLRGPLGY